MKKSLLLRIPDYLFFIFVVLFFIGINNINNSDLEYIISFSFGLLSFVGIFFTFLVVKNFLMKLQKITEETKTKLNKKISDSRSREDNLKKEYEKRIEECNTRIGYYEELQLVSTDQFIKSIMIAIIFLLLTLIIPFISYDGLIIKIKIESVKAMYFFFLVGFYHVMKVVFTFYTISSSPERT